MTTPAALPQVGNSFKALTWNVYNGTSTKVLSPIMGAQRDKGVSLFLMQEAGGVDIDKMCADHGLQTFLHPRQYRIAWDPEYWAFVNAFGLRLSDQPYYAKGQADHEQYSEAAFAILCDKAGRSLLASSYHPPADVQHDPKAPGYPQRRYDAAKESMLTLARLAKEAETTGVLFGGDDNVDENTGIGANTHMWDAWEAKTTGLQQIQAPSATHGKVRQIDDFRIPVNGSLTAGSGWVADGGGDHRLHGRTFTWL